MSTHEKNQKCTLELSPFTGVIVMFPNRIRVISRPQLNTLLCVHLAPINVIISYDPSTNTYLEVGFVLRCFQNLSIPDLATGRSSWRQSPYTRGQFTPVLSYQEQIFSIFERLQKIGNQPVSRRFEPSSRIFLNGEQPYPWQLLHHQDKMSRHRCRICLPLLEGSDYIFIHRDQSVALAYQL